MFAKAIYFVFCQQKEALNAHTCTWLHKHSSHCCQFFHSLKWMQVVTLFSSIKSSSPPSQMYSFSLTLNTPHWYFFPSVACVCVWFCFILLVRCLTLLLRISESRGHALPWHKVTTDTFAPRMWVHVHRWKYFLCFSLVTKEHDKIVLGQKALPKSANQSYHIGILVESNS